MGDKKLVRRAAAATASLPADETVRLIVAANLLEQAGFDLQGSASGVLIVTNRRLLWAPTRPRKGTPAQELPLEFELKPGVLNTNLWFQWSGARVRFLLSKDDAKEFEAAAGLLTTGDSADPVVEEQVPGSNEEAPRSEAVPPDDLEDALRTLVRLHADGLVPNDEFERRRDHILDRLTGR